MSEVTNCRNCEDCNNYGNCPIYGIGWGDYDCAEQCKYYDDTDIH